MTIYYVTNGAWGSGTGSVLAAAQIDGNFYDVDQRIVGLTSDLAEGKRIEFVTYDDTSMTFHYTDSTTQTIVLPVTTLTYVGPWMPSTPYIRGNLFTSGNGFFQVLEDHTSASTFDPNATDGTTANNPLYALWMPLTDVKYDAAIFVPGSVQRLDGELIWQGIANHGMNLAAGTANAFAFLEIGNSGASNIVLSIEKNGSEIGTITFNSGGAQDGIFSIPNATDFAEGDRYAVRVTHSADSAPADMSITLPFVRTG